MKVYIATSWPGLLPLLMVAHSGRVFFLKRSALLKNILESERAPLYLWKPNRHDIKVEKYLGNYRSISDFSNDYPEYFI